MYPPSGYKLHKSPSQRVDQHERGVALLIDKNVHSEPLDLTTSDNIEAVAARVYADRYYTICSIYFAPSLVVSKQEITSLLNQLPQPALLLGDINAKHSRWNEPDNNTRGILFDELLLEEDIALLNED